MKDFDRKVFFVYGGTDAKTRNDIRGIVEKKRMQSLSQVMVRLALVLTLGILTMSCSVHLQRVELEFSSQSVGDSVQVLVKIPLHSTCQTTYHIKVSKLYSQSL